MLLIYAITFMFVALTSYSIGVWAERVSGLLKPWHMVLFWLGLGFDISGTTVMSIMSGGFQINIHGVTGVLAIFLMAFRAMWATSVLGRRNKRLRGGSILSASSSAPFGSSPFFGNVHKHGRSALPSATHR